MPLEVVCHPRICLSLEQVDLVNKHATYGILSIGCHGDAFHVVKAIHDDLVFSLRSHGCTDIALIDFSILVAQLLLGLFVQFLHFSFLVVLKLKHVNEVIFVFIKT